MYKIKTKIWKKVFEDQEIIDSIFNEAGKLIPSINEFKGDVSEFSNSRNFFCHLETDLRNDTIGIMPKRIKSFLKNNKIEDISTMLIVLTYMVLKDGINPYLDEDQQINWDQVYKDHIGEKSIKEVIDNLNVKKVIKDKLHENIYWLFLDSDSFDFRSFKTALKMKGNLWKEVAGFIPKDEMLTLFVMPQNFNPEKMKVINKKYGGLLKLENHTKFALIQSLTRPYEKESFVYNEAFFSTKVLTEFEYKISTQLKSEVLKVLSINNSSIFNNYKYIDMLIDDLNTYKTSSEMIHKLYNFHVGAMYAFSLVSSTNQDEDGIKKFLLSLTHRVKSAIGEQHGGNNVLSRYFELWKQRSAKKDFSGELKVGKYTISICGPDDVDQLVLGELTDCCQLVGGAGESCLLSGLRNKEQGFVKVMKGNQIYAQSWFWTADTILCFDSIECPPSENIDTIVDLYIQFSEILAKKYDFNIVYTGRDGNRIPEKVLNLPSDNVFYSDYFDNGVYSDTNTNGVSILYEEEL